MGDGVRAGWRRLAFGGVRVWIAPDAQLAGRAVAAELARCITERRAEGHGAVLGVATGNTPLAVYAELARLRREEGLALQDVAAFALDEYVGLAPGSPASFREFVRRHVELPLALGSAQVHVPSGAPALVNGPDPDSAAYEAALARAGGVDVQLLGIGRNGHLAFNEPGSARDSRTRVVELAAATRAANAPDFPPGEAVPTHARTMGVATLLEARRLRVLAFGAHKASIVARALTEPAGPALPATFLREHPDVELFLDPAAAAELPGA